MIFRKNYFNIIASAWIAFFVLANALLFIGLNRVQYTVVSEIRKHRIFLESFIPHENSRVMLIDSSHVKRTNVPFWLNYTYTASMTKPAGTLIQKSQIPTGTDYLILLDQYPLDFEPVKMDRDSRVTILHMVREDMRRLLSGVYQDYWTKKEFAFDSPSKFQTMRVTLSDWQPSYPNKLTIRADKDVMTYLLDGNNKILSLPYAQHYSFILEKTWNPKHAGLNNDNRDLGVSIQKVEIIP
jgi:hypothetical protein